MVRYLFYTIGDLTYQSPLVLQSAIFRYAPEANLSVCISARKAQYHHVIVSSANKPREVIRYDHYDSAMGFRLSEVLTL